MTNDQRRNHEFEEMMNNNLKIKSRVFDLAKEQILRFFDHIGFRVIQNEQSKTNRFEIEFYSLDQEYEQFVKKVKI